MEDLKLPKNEDGALVLPADEPPKSGVFSEWDGMQHDPDVIEDGNSLGDIIFIDDDEDNGLSAVGEEPYHV